MSYVEHATIERAGSGISAAGESFERSRSRTGSRRFMGNDLSPWDSPGREGLRLNHHGMEAAKLAIAHGKVRTDPFSFSDDEQRAMLGPEGTDWVTHSAHHLGLNGERPLGNIGRYTYPMGKEGHIYVRALHGIRNAAHQAGHTEIRDAASMLLGRALCLQGIGERSRDSEAERHRIKLLFYGHRTLNLR
jgi:hypothetical protein